MAIAEEMDTVTASTAGTVDRHDTAETFESTNPATGAVVGVFPVHDADAVAATVTRARTVAAHWRELGFDGRRQRLAAWRGYLARRMHELADLVHRENGKPHADALLEITLAVDHLAWAGAHAKKVLGLRRVPAGLLAANHAAYVEYQPMGVVGVIGPWNYPVYTPMGSISYALAAGNAVVFKPSEHTPRTGEWLAKAGASAVNRDSRAGGASTGGTSTGEASPVNGLSRADGVSAGGAFAGAGVLQVVTGDGGAGAALCAAGVDKVAFTGSAATGRKVMAAWAQTLTPVVIEGGGKDAMIVAADADLDAAAKAAAFGGFGKAGQTCAGVERVYVERAVYPDFLTRLKAIAESLDPNDLPY